MVHAIAVRLSSCDQLWCMHAWEIGGVLEKLDNTVTFALYHRNAYFGLTQNVGYEILEMKRPSIKHFHGNIPPSPPGTLGVHVC